MIHGATAKRDAAEEHLAAAQVAAVDTCSRAPRTWRSSTHDPVEHPPHRCTGHRQAPYTLTMPAARRRSASRAIPYKQVVLAAFDLPIAADPRSVDELAQAFLAS